MQVATDLTVDLFRIPKRINLAEKIADAVARAIASGLLEPDERVTETAIADRVGVSRADPRGFEDPACPRDFGRRQQPWLSGCGF